MDLKNTHTLRERHTYVLERASFLTSRVCVTHTQVRPKYGCTIRQIYREKRFYGKERIDRERERYGGTEKEAYVYKETHI